MQLRALFKSFQMHLVSSLCLLWLLRKRPNCAAETAETAETKYPAGHWIITLHDASTGNQKFKTRPLHQIHDKTPVHTNTASDGSCSSSLTTLVHTEIRHASGTPIPNSVCLMAKQQQRHRRTSANTEF